MANLSYCRFQNTVGDLHDCWFNLHDNLGKDEHNARMRLLKTCKQIVQDAEHEEYMWEPYQEEWDD